MTFGPSWTNPGSFYGEGELRRIERLFPEHRTHILSGVGHFIQDDAPVEIIEVIRDWTSPVE